MKGGPGLAFRILPPGMKRTYALCVLLLALSSSLQAQLGVDESKLYAQTKQVNQFFCNACHPENNVPLFHPPLR